eukprot:2109783-Rhodomonas_salina.2
MQLPGIQQEGVLQDHIGQAVTSEDDRSACIFADSGYVRGGRADMFSDGAGFALAAFQPAEPTATLPLELAPLPPRLAWTCAWKRRASARFLPLLLLLGRR